MKYVFQNNNVTINSAQIVFTLQNANIWWFIGIWSLFKLL